MEPTGSSAASRSCPSRPPELRSARGRSADVTLIIGFGPPIGITYPRHNGAIAARHTSFVAGLHDSYAIVQAGEWQSGIEVNLTPLGTHLLLGVPMEALTNRVVDLEDVRSIGGEIRPRRARGDAVACIDTDPRTPRKEARWPLRRRPRPRG